MITVGSYTLDHFQEQAVIRARDSIARGHKSILIVSPTGSGKTIIAAAIMAACVEKGKRLWFITRGRQLVFQMAETLTEMGIWHTVMMANSETEYSPGAQVTICSKDTLDSRIKRKLPHRYPDVFIVDEADICISKAWLQILKHGKIVIGLTATPCDGNGEGLGKPLPYTDMIIAASFSDLIESGRLVDIPEGNVFSPYRPSLDGAKVSGGDYNQKWLADRMDDDKLVGDIVKEWMKHGDDRKTVVFCSGVKHSIHVADAFNQQGIPAEHIDGTTPQEERTEIFDNLRGGRTQIISNCAVLDRGWDEPAIGCGILAKPTKRLRAYIQMVGRLIRSAPGKKDAILIDHSGAAWSHGWPTRDRLWTLHRDQSIEDKEHDKPAKDQKEREPHCCPECACMWQNGPKCPNCGHKYAKRGQKAKMVDGTLVTVTRKGVKARHKAVDGPQKRWLTLLGRCANTGQTYSQASARFYNAEGKYPNQVEGVGPLAKYDDRYKPVAAIWPGFRRRK